jgi:hypothetical protein
MPDRVGDGSSLQERVKDAYAMSAHLVDRAKQDSVALRHLLEAPAQKLENLQGRFDLFTRMAFSCLVDADNETPRRRAPDPAHVMSSRGPQAIIPNQLLSRKRRLPVPPTPANRLP